MVFIAATVISEAAPYTGSTVQDPPWGIAREFDTVNDSLSGAERPASTCATYYCIYLCMHVHTVYALVSVCNTLALAVMQ